MRSFERASIAVVVAAAVGISARAVAAPFCIPQAAGVPGAAGGPVWWGGGTSPVDDPRWRGAATFENAAGQMRFRALVDGTGTDRALVLSWQVVNDSTAGDRVYVGFFDTAGGKGNMFEMTRHQPAPPDGGTGSVTSTFNATTISADGWYWTGTQWGAVSGLPHFPAWLGDDGRLDVSCEASGCDVWTIRLRVPLVTSGGNWASPSQASGLQLPTTFKLFYEIKSVENQLTPTYSALEWDDRGVDLTNPSNFSDENALGAPRFPDVAGWPVLSLDTSDPTCARGMSFDASTVKIVNGPSGAAGGTRIDLGGANTFHVAPVNHTGSPWAQASLLASLRISDWGPAKYAAPTWRPLSGCGTTTAGTGAFADGASDDLSCTWTPSASERCAYDATLGCASTLGAKYRYQCYFIELRTASSTFYYPSGSDVFCESEPPADAGTTPDAAVDATADVGDARPTVDAERDLSADVASANDAETDGAPVLVDAPMSVDASAANDAPMSIDASAANDAPPADASVAADAPAIVADAGIDARPAPTSGGQGGCGCTYGSATPRDGTVLFFIFVAGAVSRRRRRWR